MKLGNAGLKAWVFYGIHMLFKCPRLGQFRSKRQWFLSCLNLHLFVPFRHWDLIASSNRGPCPERESNDFCHRGSVLAIVEIRDFAVSYTPDHCGRATVGQDSASRVVSWVEWNPLQRPLLRRGNLDAAKWHTSTKYLFDMPWPTPNRPNKSPTPKHWWSGSALPSISNTLACLVGRRPPTKYFETIRSYRWDDHPWFLHENNRVQLRDSPARRFDRKSREDGIGIPKHPCIQ